MHEYYIINIKLSFWLEEFLSSEKWIAAEDDLFSAFDEID